MKECICVLLRSFKKRGLFCFIFLLSAGQVFSDAPRLECEKKWGEIVFQGKRIMRYRLRASNFPEGARFCLFVKWFNGEEADTFFYRANHRGHLILEEKRKKDPLYAVCPLKNGERISFLMKSEKEPFLNTEVSLVPFPIAKNTKSGLKLSIELLGQDGDLFRVLGSGFCSGEVIELLASFQGKEQRYRAIASSQGVLDFPVQLELIDRDGGECLLTLGRAKEEIPFSFHVGRAALAYAGGFVLEIK